MSFIERRRCCKEIKLVREVLEHGVYGRTTRRLIIAYDPRRGWCRGCLAENTFTNPVAPAVAGSPAEGMMPAKPPSQKPPLRLPHPGSRH